MQSIPEKIYEENLLGSKNVSKIKEEWTNRINTKLILFEEDLILMSIQKAKKVLMNTPDSNDFYTCDEEIDDLNKLCNEKKNK